MGSKFLNEVCCFCLIMPFDWKQGMLFFENIEIRLFILNNQSRMQDMSRKMQGT